MRYLLRILAFAALTAGANVEPTRPLLSAGKNIGFRTQDFPAAVPIPGLTNVIDPDAKMSITGDGAKGKSMCDSVENLQMAIKKTTVVGANDPFRLIRAQDAIAQGFVVISDGRVTPNGRGKSPGHHSLAIPNGVTWTVAELKRKLALVNGASTRLKGPEAKTVLEAALKNPQKTLKSVFDEVKRAAATPSGGGGSSVATNAVAGPAGSSQKVAVAPPAAKPKITRRELTWSRPRMVYEAVQESKRALMQDSILDQLE